jgi:endonuclease/exonuclease/phosphatase family metal-dependent hydrolase
MRDQFTVATFNLLNFIDANRVYYDRESYSTAQYDAKCNWLAEQFDRTEADIIAVQECWSQDALRDAVSRSKRLRQATTVEVPGAQNGSDLPKVGLISNFALLKPIESIKAIPATLQADLPGLERHTEFSRPVLKAMVNLALPEAEALPLHLFNLHLKSKRPEFLDGEDLDDPKTQAHASLRSLIMRGAEAAALRLLVLDSLLDSHTPVIVTGDFNDNAEAVTTEIVAGRAALHDRQARDYLLYNAALLAYRHKLQRSVGYSHIHQGDPDTIDHFLLSEEFVAESKHCLYRLARLDYFNDHLNNKDQTQSDHAVVRAQFVKLD